jgi:hypothetical protein
VAYFPPSKPRAQEQPYGQGGPGFGTGASAGGGGSTPVSGSATAPPVNGSGGGSFQAIRGFFDANAPTADARAAELFNPVLDDARNALDLTNQANRTFTDEPDAENLRENAVAARDDALSDVRDLGNPETVQARLGAANPQADYTEGMRAADSYLLGRSEPARLATTAWGETLAALNPTPLAAPGPNDFLRQPNYTDWRNSVPRGDLSYNDWVEAQRDAYREQQRNTLAPPPIKAPGEKRSR